MAISSIFVVSVTTLVLVLTTKTAKSWTWNLDDVGPDGLPQGRPLIIGHRGFSGVYPEHTSLAYHEAAVQGADLIECDLTITKDLQFICNHDSWIGDISNVNDMTVGPSHPDFSNKLATYNMDDDDPGFDWNDKGNVTDFFAIDFTLEELLSLRRKQADLQRDPSFDWKYPFITFDHFVAIAKNNSVGIYPEIKQVTAMNEILKSRNITKSYEDLVLEALAKHNYLQADDPCFLQSFELTTLEKLSGKTNLRRIFLLKAESKAVPDTFERVKNSGIYGVGLNKLLLVEVQSDSDPQPGHIKTIHTDRIQQIKDLGLKLHVYTFRNEPAYLNWDDGQDYRVEYQRFLDLGIDGFFTDFPKSLSDFFETFSSKNDSNCIVPSAFEVASLIFLLLNWKYVI